MLIKETDVFSKRVQRLLDSETYRLLQLRLAADQPAGFRRDWPVVNVSPAKHRGYALQWFTMAAVLLLLFVLRSSNIVGLLRGNHGEERS